MPAWFVSVKVPANRCVTTAPSTSEASLVLVAVNVKSAFGSSAPAKICVMFTFDVVESVVVPSPLSTARNWFGVMLPNAHDGVRTREGSDDEGDDEGEGGDDTMHGWFSFSGVPVCGRAYYFFFGCATSSSTGTSTQP